MKWNMHGRRRTESVSDSGIVASADKTNPSPVFVLFLIVSGEIRPRAPEVDNDLDEVSACAVFGLGSRL